MSVKQLQTPVDAPAVATDAEILAVGDVPIAVPDNSPEVSIGLSPVEVPQGEAALTAEEALNVLRGRTTENLLSNPVPLYTFNLQNEQLPALRDMLDARKLEAELDQALVDQLYSIAESSIGDPDKIAGIIELVDQEVADADTRLAAVESLIKLYRQSVLAFVGTAQKDVISALATTISNAYGFDPLVANEFRSSQDWWIRLHQMSDINLEHIQPGMRPARGWAATVIYGTCIAQLQFLLQYGASPNFFGYATHGDGGQYYGSNELSDIIPWPVSTAQPKVVGVWENVRTIQSISMKGLSTGGNVLTLTREFNPYTPNGTPLGRDGTLGYRKQLERLRTVGGEGLQSLAWKCSVLSREFLLSAGMGRLQGTTTGQRYGIGFNSDWLQKLTGLDPGVFIGSVPLDSMFGSAMPQDPPGQIAAWPLEGDITTEAGSSHANGRGEVPSGLDFLQSLTAEPFTNSLDEFTSILDAGRQNLDDISGILTTLLSRDQPRTLLSARGLFTRILKDFADYLDNLNHGSDVARRTLIDLGIFATLFESDPADGILTEHLYFTAIQAIASKAPALSDEDIAVLVERRELQRQIDAELADPLGASAASLSSLRTQLANTRLPSDSMNQVNVDEQLLMIMPNEAIRLAEFRGGQEHHANTPGSVWLIKQARAMISPGGLASFLGAPSIGRSNWSSDAMRAKYIIRPTGHQVEGAFSSQGLYGQGLLRNVIVRLFEDLQAEASALAGEGKTYMGNDQKTLNSSFDGQLCLAIITECFAELVGRFVNVGIYGTYLPNGLLEPNKVVSPKEYSDGAQEWTDEWNFFVRNKSTQFTLKGCGGPSNDYVYVPSDTLNIIRGFLGRAAAASEANDISGLYNAATGRVTPSVEEAYGVSTLDWDIVGCPTTGDVLGTMVQLAREDDYPTVAFSIARAFLDNVAAQTATIRAVGTAMKSESAAAANPTAATLRQQLSGVNLEFLKGMSGLQIDSARTRLRALKGAAAPGYPLKRVNADMIKAYELLLDSKEGSFKNGTVLFVGIPDGFVEEKLRLDVGIMMETLPHGAINRDTLRLSVHKVDAAIPNLIFDPAHWDFFPFCKTTSAFVSEAFAADPPPTDFHSLVMALRYNVKFSAEPVTGTQIVFDLDVGTPDEATARLTNEVESFLLKSMFQSATGFAFEEEMLQYDPLREGTPQAVDLAQLLMKPAGLSAAAVASALDAQSTVVDGLLDNSARRTLMQPQMTSFSGSVAWSVPAMTSTQLDALQSLSITKPFFVERVNEFVFSRSIFERVMAIFVNLDLPPVDLSVNNLYASLPFPGLRGNTINPENSQSPSGHHSELANRDVLDKFSLPSLYVVLSRPDGED